MKYIFSTWNKISPNVKTAGHILLVLDCDDIVIPTTKNPNLIMLSKNSRNMIKTLADHHFFTVGIISDRSLADVKKSVAVDNIYYSGNRGLEIEGPEMKFTLPDAKKLMPQMLLIKEKLDRELKDIKGVFIENKGLTFNIHYHEVREAEMSIAKNIIKSVLKSLAREEKIKIKIKITSAKKMLEVRPSAELDKGKIIIWMIKNLSFNHHNILPVYIGDDQADISAFKVINRKKGLSIFVGEDFPNSHINYYLKSLEDVRLFLGKIKNAINAK